MKVGATPVTLATSASLAPTFVSDPKILILDEATSALDTTNERLVQQARVPLMAGRTTVAIAHRLSTILAADVIFVLDRGHLVERGAHTEFLARGGRYAQLYHHQFGTNGVPRPETARQQRHLTRGI